MKFENHIFTEDDIKPGVLIKDAQGIRYVIAKRILHRSEIQLVSEKGIIGEVMKPKEAVEYLNKRNFKIYIYENE